MKARVVRIGKSRGIRIPKALIEQCHLQGVVDLEVQHGQLVIRSAAKPRVGWHQAFQEMHRRGDDRLLVPVTEDDIEDALLAYSPKLRKKIEEGLRDIRAGRTLALSDYRAARFKKKTCTA